MVRQAEGVWKVADTVRLFALSRGIVGVDRTRIILGIVEGLESVDAPTDTARLVAGSAAETLKDVVRVELRSVERRIVELFPAGHVVDLHAPGAAERILRMAQIPLEAAATDPLGQLLAQHERLRGLIVLADDEGWRTHLAEVFQNAEGHGSLRTWAPRVVEEGRLGVELADRLAHALARLESLTHVGLVWTVANRMAKGNENRVAEDLFGWGWQGLCAALKSYDPTTAAFSTYAVRRINGAILDGIRSEHHLPKRLVSLLNNVRNADEELTKELGRSPRLEELAAEVDATLLEMELAMTRYQPPASIEELQAGGDPEEATLRWYIPDEEEPETEAIEALLTEAVEAGLGRLEGRERQVIQLSILESRSIRQTAEALGMDPREVRRLRDRGLARLRQELGTWSAA